MQVIKSGISVVLLAVLCLGSGRPAASQEVPHLDERGLHVQEWFLESFLDLNEDIAETASRGKDFVIVWEQRGCPYCREMHLVNFAQPEVRDYIKNNFEVVQIDKRGMREVTAFDGRKTTEKELAKSLKVRFTPTVTFHALLTDAKTGRKEAVEVARMTGYYRPIHFLMAHKYVREKAYLNQKFKQFVVARMAAREKQGKTVRFR